MAKTRHFQKRMNQRGINQEVVDIVKKFGFYTAEGDKCVLNKKGIDAALGCLDEHKRKLLKARDKGGVVVVDSGGYDITAYNLDSYDRNHRLH